MQVNKAIVEGMKVIWNSHPDFHHFGGFGFCGTASELLRQYLEKKNIKVTLLVGKQLKDNFGMDVYYFSSFAMALQ